MQQTTKPNGSLCKRLFYHGCVDLIIFLAILVNFCLITLLFFDQVPFPTTIWYHRLSEMAIANGSGQILVACWIFICLLIGLVFIHLALASLICYSIITLTTNRVGLIKNSPSPFLDKICYGLIIFLGFVFPFIIAFCFAAKNFFQKNEKNDLVPSPFIQFKKCKLILFSSYLMVFVANTIFVGLPLTMVYLNKTKPFYSSVNCKRFYRLSQTANNLLYFHFRGIDGWKVEQLFKKNIQLKTDFKDFTLYRNHLSLSDARLTSLPYSLFGHNGNIFEKQNLRTPLKRISVRSLAYNSNSVDFPGSCLINVSELSLADYYKLCTANFVSFWNYFGFQLVNICNFPYFGKQASLQVYPNNAKELNEQMRSDFGFKDFTAVCASELQNYKHQKAHYNNIDDANVIGDLTHDWEISNNFKGVFCAVFSQQTYGQVSVRDSQNRYRHARNTKPRTLLNSIENAFVDLSRIFNYLKEHNIYKNTAIVIVSDHGYYLKNHTGQISKKYVGRFSPVFMIKPYRITQTSLMINNQSLITSADQLTLIRRLLFPHWRPSLTDPLNPALRFKERYRFFNNYQPTNIYDNKNSWNRSFQLFRPVDERYLWWRKNLKIASFRSFHYQSTNHQTIFDERNWSSEIK